MTDKFETMPSHELLAYVFKDNSKDRFVDTIVPNNNYLGRSRAYHDTKTNNIYLHTDLVDKAISMRMLEICESQRSLIQEDINNERGDIQSLIEQLKIYDNLINEVNENSLAILGRYKDFMNREIVND